MNCQTAYIRSLAAQIGLNGSISVNAAMRVIDIANGSFDTLFLLVIFRFPVLEKIVVGIGTNAEFS